MSLEPGAIFGLDSDSLPEGSIPLEAFAIVKRLSGDGESGLSIRITSGFDNAELATLLRVEAARLEKRVADSWHRSEPDDE